MDIQLKHIPAFSVIAWRQRLSIPQIPAHSGPAIHRLFESLKRNGAKPAGSDIIYVYKGCNGDPTVEFDLEICLPVDSGLILEPEAPMELTTISPFQCAAMEYAGPMSTIGQAWMNVVRWIREKGHTPTSQSREIYKKWISADSPENVTELQQGIQ